MFVFLIANRINTGFVRTQTNQLPFSIPRPLSEQVHQHPYVVFLHYIPFISSLYPFAPPSFTQSLGLGRPGPPSEASQVSRSPLLYLPHNVLSQRTK